MSWINRWWKGLSLLAKLALALGIVATVAIALVTLRGPTPPPEVVYP